MEIPKTPTKPRTPQKGSTSAYRESPSRSVKSSKARKRLSDQDFQSISHFMKIPTRPKSLKLRFKVPKSTVNSGSASTSGAGSGSNDRDYSAGKNSSGNEAEGTFIPCTTDSNDPIDNANNTENNKAENNKTESNKSENNNTGNNTENNHTENSRVWTSSEKVAVDAVEDANSTVNIADSHEDKVIREIECSIPNLRDRYRILEKVGEGAFSEVYKAHDFKNTSVVAMKKIHSTSSPQRIYTELKFLYNLKGCRNVVPIVDALRFEDQILIVLPYYEHASFSDFYRDIPIHGIQIYIHELLKALSFVHSRGIIHRDIKPNNFLFNPATKHGVLVDFGLAEKVRDVKHSCQCSKGGSTVIPTNKISGYPKDDDRPARRANRAGTRGFRAPEVLLKCPNQTPKIDVWSVGVILLSLISRRFPFFNSTDDTDALIELTTIFGTRLMRHCAALHGLGMDTNLETLQDSSRSLSEIVFYALNIEKTAGTLPTGSVALQTLGCLNQYGNTDDSEIGRQHKALFHLLGKLMELNFSKRYSAETALSHPFFASFHDHDELRVELSEKDYEDIAVI